MNIWQVTETTARMARKACVPQRQVRRDEGGVGPPRRLARERAGSYPYRHIVGRGGPTRRGRLQRPGCPRLPPHSSPRLSVGSSYLYREAEAGGEAD
eukprot:scaffold20571_cov111-Isochrysis_galbana.AAC.7